MPKGLLDNYGKRNPVKRIAMEVRKLSFEPNVRKVVKQRMKEFQEINHLNSFGWFKELVFCILTANSSAMMGLKCVEALEENSLIFQGPVDKVRKTLEEQGHRFALRRAEYIVEARSRSRELKQSILKLGNTQEAREWLVKEFKGIGWKEGSHFLRNVGFLDLAILDRHVLRVMSKYGLISKEIRGLTKKKYLEYEKILREVAKEVKMPLGELDLYLWYAQTKKILK